MSATRSETETAREVDIGRLSPESLKDLYLSEREQSQTIRSQLAVPVTIISFLIFGYVSFAQEIDISRWYEPVTLTALILSVVSVLLIFAAMVYLGRVERTFLGAGPQTIEAQLSGNNEAGFFLDAIGSVRKHNDAASRCRAPGLLPAACRVGELHSGDFAAAAAQAAGHGGERPGPPASLLLALRGQLAAIALRR